MKINQCHPAQRFQALGCFTNEQQLVDTGIGTSQLAEAVSPYELPDRFETGSMNSSSVVEVTNDSPRNQLGTERSSKGRSHRDFRIYEKKIENVNKYLGLGMEVPRVGNITQLVISFY